MPDADIIRELRMQAKIYNQAADVLEGKLPAKKRRTMSAEGRRRIAMAQKKRWALIRGGKKAA